MSAKPPSERVLKDAERELKKLPPGAQRAVGGWIHMRLDADGRRRFQYRTRGGGAGAHAGGTYDSWDEAVRAREAREELAKAAADLGGLESVGDLRKMKLRRYAERWWKHVVNDLEPLTHLDYAYGLKMALEVAGDYTLEQFEQSPLIVDEVKSRLKKLKTRPKDDPVRPGYFASAAADKGLKVLSAILTHAVDNGVISHNRFQGVEYFHRKRGPNGKKSNGHRAIKQSEVMHPRTVALAGLGMRGSVAQIEAGRLVPELIAYEGMRPQDVCAMRHRWWRDENGPRSHILLEDAVKDLKGHLVIGEAKTGEREPVLWPSVAEQLERVYQAQGCPDLDALVVPNEVGTYLDWGNWRRVWYRALYLAGISNAPAASAPGAFEPYLLRHIAAVTMTHAQRPAEVGGGVYSRYEVARHLGHTVDTLDKVYADIPGDLLGIAGLTMDEIIRRARREAWGPIPRDPDYEEVLYTTNEASSLTGVSITALCARCQRGSLPAVLDGGKYYISDHALVLVGLLPPVLRR